MGGAVALAEQIRKWYQEWHQSHPGKQFDELIISTIPISSISPATIPK